MEIKSIFTEDLRCNDVGNHIRFEAETFFKMLLEKFPEHNPREMAGLCSAEFNALANRRIIHLRKSFQSAEVSGKS